MPPSPLAFAAAAVVALAVPSGVTALNNGLGQTPAMGYSTWNACSSFRDNGPNGWCYNTEAYMHNVTAYMISSGLAKLGYTQINVDEGWLKGRLPNGTIYEDTDKFPSGMKALGDFVHSQETYPGSGEYMKYGLYSCRGTCQCGTGTYSGPGSNGFEAADTQWMIDAGADYLKIDSCCGSQDHATAFSDYAKFRDAMNKSGRPVFFSLCGWEEWYAPADPSVNYTGGYSLGNSWRIAGDGSGWGPLTNCMNTIAAVAHWSGPGGWSDPDLLIGPEVYVGGQTDEQARAQFSMWSLFPANLLISQNVLTWSPYALETYSNAEAIAINQDTLGLPATRIVGGDLPFPCSGAGALAAVVAADCDATDPAQQWTYDAATSTFRSVPFAAQNGVLDVTDCAKADGSPVAVWPYDNGQGTCNGANQKWTFNPSSSTGSTAVNGNSGSCLDVYDWTGPLVDNFACNGGSNQNFTLTDGLLKTAASPGHPSMCLSASKQECTNVWGRTLSDGWALGFVNNGDAAANVTCDAACFALLNLTASVQSLVVRDVWAHRDVATLAPPFSFTDAINGSGFAGLYKLRAA